MNRNIRDYEVSVWTLQDSFITVLKPSGTDNKGRIEEPDFDLKNDGTLTFKFSIPMYLKENNVNIENPIWYNTTNGNIIADLRKIKVIFHKNTEYEYIFELLITKVTESHEGFKLICNVECEGLAFHELGKIGYKLSLNQDTFIDDWTEWANDSNAAPEDEPKSNINYWCDKVFDNTNWTYEIQMDWSGYDTSREPNIIYEDAYAAAWDVRNDKFIPTTVVKSKEKERLIDVEESNRYNISQTIAETFGVHCRYQYEHDNDYHITNRKVIFYNSFIQESLGPIDVNYAYDTANISREMDSKDTITKMYVKTLTDSNTESGLATIADAAANKSQEDYLLNFDYLYSIGTISQGQYDAVEPYEIEMHRLNEELKGCERQINALENQKIDAAAAEAVAKNAVSLDNERISANNDLLNAITNNTGVVHVTAARPDTCVIISNNNNSYITLRQKGIIPTTIHIYENFTPGATNALSNEINSYTLNYDEFGNLTKISNITPSSENTHIVYLIYDYEPQLYYENILKTWEIRLARDTNEQQFQEQVLENINAELTNLNAIKESKLNEKKDAIRRFEHLMGPAIREGYWQPEDEYAKYGEKKTEILTLNSAAEFNDNLSSIGWDNELFEEEDKNYYEIEITQTQEYYPCIKLPNLNVFRNYDLNKISFIYQDTTAPQGAVTDDIRYLRFLPIGSQCQLRFLRDSENVIPVLMLTGLKDVNYDIFNNSYSHPRIGILTTEVNNGSIDSNIYVIIDEATVRQNLIPSSAAASYEIVYSRIQINSANLKVTEDSLVLRYGNIVLNNYEDYYVLGRLDNSTNIFRYYITIKPEVLFKKSNYGSYNLLYELSNTGLFMYLDALQVMKENAYPRVSYEIKPTFVNDEFIRYAYKYLNYIIHINDPELKFEYVKGYITELHLNLDSPKDDTITIDNYKTKFEDLFSTIVVQTEEMKKNSTLIGMAAQAFTPTGGLQADLVQTVMDKVDLNYAFNNGTLTINEEDGIWGTSDSGVVAFRGGGIFTATEKNDNGEWIWNTGILPSGINASLITTGQLDTNLIRVFAGNDLKFQLNGDGLYAYRSWWDYENNDNAPATINRRDDGLDFGQYVVHNSEGLFLTAKQGTILNGKTLEQDVNRVEVSWDGLIIRNLNNNPVFYADTNGNLNIAGRITATSLSIQSEAVNQLDEFIANSNTVVNVIPGLIQTRIQNIEIGGINLIPSRRGTIWTTEKGVFINYDYGNHYYSQGKYRIEFNSVDAPLPDYSAVIWLSGVSMTEGDYTLSFWCWREGINDSVNPAPKITTELRENNTRYKIFNDGEFYPNSNTPHKYELHVHMDEDKILNLGFIISNLWTDTNAHVYITDVKLEKGIHATQWSAASEDIMDIDRRVTINTSTITQTANEIRAEVKAITIGGTNLLLNSKETVESANYLLKEYNIVTYAQEDFENGELYTIQIKGTLGQGKTEFHIYNSNDYVFMCALTADDYNAKTGIYTKTFEWTNTRSGYVGDNSKILIYAIPSEVTINSTIEWVKLEKGNKPTAWSPASEDTEEEIEALTTRIYTAEQQILPNAIISTVRSSPQYTTDLNGKANVSDLNGKADASELANYSTLRQTADDISAAVANIDEFHAGTVVTITAQQTKIATPIFEVDISDSDEQLKLDNGGGVMTNLSVTERIEAPNIAERYTGKYGRVEIGSNGDYSNYLEFAGAVSDKIILEDIDVWSEADFYGVLYLHGIHGSGNITIHMNYDDDNDVNAYHSQIGLRNNGVVIVFDGCCFKANISVEGQTTVKFTNCFFKAGAASCLSMIDGVTAWMDGCTLNGTGNLIELVRGVHLSAQNIAGTTTGNFIFARFATICWYGTRPQGSNNTVISLTTPSDLSTLTVDPGDGGSLIPSEPITVELTATLTDAYWWTSDDSNAGWYGGGRLIQGLQTYRHAAVMWFNTNAFTGKTIKNATLTIKRISGQGRTTTVDIQVYTTPLSTNGGNPRTNSVYYDNIGSIANGQTKTFTIPVAAIQAIANGTMKGLMLWPNDTAVLYGHDYSANYARFEGTTGTAPVLTVTYQ